MAIHGNGRAYECVLVDLNTQCDLCTADGAHPVANRAELIPALRRVIAWVKRNHAPIISSIESHRRWELSDRHPSNLCCLDGSDGQRKIDFTILQQHARIELDNTLSISIDLFSRYQQVIFRKRTDDLLGNPKADRFVTQLPAKEFVVFGIGTECSVKAVALALLTRERKVSIVVDACGYWNRGTAELALRQIEAKGATLITVDELLGRKLDRHHRYPIAINPAGRRNGRTRQAERAPVTGIECGGRPDCRPGRIARAGTPAHRSNGTNRDRRASQNAP